ncbi:MAG: FAD-dependent thymidylate synthase [Patescibacteria group bacterium]
MKYKNYEPDFCCEFWTPEEANALQPFATNLDGLVTCLRNLPPEIVGALCSRASRANGYLLRVLLDEYLKPILNGEDKELAKELNNTIDFLQKHGFKNILNNQRAQSFYAKWLAQYGDDSISQITGTHVVFWGISQVAMKFIQDQRIGLEPIEKSTRFVNFGKKVGGKYLYYTPKPDLERLGLLEEYKATLDNLFDAYVALLPPLVNWLKENFNEKESVLEKKAFDALRGLLPMATLGQVAFRGNAQAFEYLINRSAKNPLGELRWIAEALKQELDQEIPSLLLRLEDEKSQKYQEYLSERHKVSRQTLEEYEPQSLLHSIANSSCVRLIEYDQDTENKIIAGIIFASSHCGWDGALHHAKIMRVFEKRRLLKAYLLDRNARWQKVGRAFENSYLRFEIVMDIGAYRDLHRHRMMTQERQRFSTHHGFEVPPEVKEAGLSGQFSEALEKIKPLFEKIESEDFELAQYVVPLAYRVRFYQLQNFRQLFWETELRTTSQGHPNYRFIEQEKYRLVKEKFPLLAEFMLVDMNKYDIARRGTEKRIEEKEKKILDKLK